jgi:ABC-type multidrug transport system ATPase subunit
MGRRPGTAHCDPWPRTTLRQAPTVAISANAYGAGKTTTVRILATLSRPDGGRARVAGFDVVRDRRQVRRRISLTGQFAALDAAQTGEENLRMIARLAGQSRAAARRRAGELLEQFAAGSTWPPAWPAGRR